MIKLAELQRDMQRAVMGKSTAVDGLLTKPPVGSASQRLDVYRNGYGLRLTEFMSHDFEKLRTYLGNVRFNEMAARYIAAHPSDQPNARWFSRHLPEFLKHSPHYRRQPEIAELATLERAINDAFDGPDDRVITMADLAAIAPEDFPGASFHIASTVRRFAVTTNVISLWSCLKCDELPPPPEDIAKHFRDLKLIAAVGYEVAMPQNINHPVVLLVFSAHTFIEIAEKIFDEIGCR